VRVLHRPGRPGRDFQKVSHTTKLVSPNGEAGFAFNLT
jgi:hypothetical protein